MSDNSQDRATPGLLLVACTGVVLGVVAITAFCLMGNWWLLPVALLVLIVLAVLMALAVVHIIDTGTVRPDIHA